MSIIDAREREAALDPLKSFCVSAPAGSGKTELLIQRFLALLARVQRPEQVLAITFTRKAAAEMRERVVQALRDARAGTPCEGDHQRRTRELALAALAVDGERGWRLMSNPARFNIRTIDGFCAALTRQMPILSRFGAQATAVDDPGPLYAEAVAELFTMVDSDHPVAADLRGLMLHFDNHWERLAELLQSLLARRDQWLNYIGVHGDAEYSEQQVLGTLQRVIQDALGRLQEQLAPYLGELYELQCYAAGNLGEEEPGGHAGREVGDLPTWRGLRRLLLTCGGTWRSRITKNEGFPAGKTGKPAEMKQRLTGLIADLNGNEALREALCELDTLPEIEADSTSWRLVVQLSRVLPLLAAQLLLVFQHRGAVDHSQVALSALQALGEDDAPTDLALRLDYRIEHILVDEFQDTASNQFELMHRLTRGWGEYNEANPQAPRTFLIVGDGMQSIYGFRDANVGLFLKARKEGFNGVTPGHLKLSCNFRSEAGVVDWVNRTFAQVFPDRDNTSRGEVKFSKAEAVKSAAEGEAVEITVFSGEGAEAEEAKFVCDGVKAALGSDTEATIAILGRTRPQLQEIVAELRARDIAFAAQDMDRLEQSPVVQDLMTLVRALANRADRVAWMALLRAPWCGLRLADLLQIARTGDAGRYQDLLALAGDPAALPGLSGDGRQRLARVGGALQWAEARRDRLSLRAWVEQVWLRLGGPATAPRESALADAERFLQLLERAELEGLGLDIPWLEAQLERLYASAGDPDARVQVMTLHKAKGLEFDYVFIPALARASASDKRPLLRWDEYSGNRGPGGFLLAADDHSDPREPGLYNYLGHQRKRKQALETTRLLYVGATRAIRRLVLSGVLKRDENSGEIKAPGERTLLACIWPAVEQEANIREVAAGEQAAEVARAPSLLRLRRWPAGPEPVPPEGEANTGDGNIPEPAGNRLERHVGTVVHQALEVLAQRSPLPEAPGARERDTCRWALAGLGLHGDEREQALSRVMLSLERTLGDEECGRWLLRADHPESACELALTRIDPAGAIGNIIIDRSFIDASTGERWIVDYKTSSPPPELALEDFLAEEAARYHSQLQSYRDAMAELGTEPIRCALYFTSLARLHLL